MGTVERLLFRIFGRRIALLFGGISLLSAAVLASLYLVANYAVQAYVGEQLNRIPWDIIVGQRDAARNYPDFQSHLRSIPGVKRVEAFGFLRVINGVGVQLQIDGQPLPVRWIAIAGSSDPSLVPPDLKAAGCRDPGSNYVCAALVGARDPATGKPLAVAAGAVLQLRKVRPGEVPHDHHDHGHSDDATVEIAIDTPDVLFQATLAQPVQIERQEINKWMLRTVGSMAYLPEQAVVVVVPMERFAQVADLFDRSFGASAGLHGAEAAPPYVPEVMHLIALDRSRWITPWRFDPSLDALAALQHRLYNDVRDLTIFSFVGSDTFVTLNRMYHISRLIGMVTLLVAIPLLWLSWAVANMLSSLLLMNERRLIGLALIRGVPAPMINRSLITALIVGGLAGSVLGLAMGVGITVGVEAIAGAPTPPMKILLHALAYFLVFGLVSVGIAVMAGWTVIRWVRDMTPREAIAHISSAVSTATRPGSSLLAAMTGVALLLLGLYKLVSWSTGVNPLSAVSPLPVGLVEGLRILDTGLDFLAIPFFLFGVTSLLCLRIRWVQYTLSAMSAPIAGRLSWFVAEHMAANRQRVAGTLFIASLAMSLALLPQVASDAFEHRMLRGVEAAIGADVQIEYGVNDLGADGAGLRSAADHRAAFAPRLSLIEHAIRSNPSVTGVATIEQYIDPDVYVPNQQGLLINLLRSTEDYLRLAYSEPGLGVGRPFGEVIRASADGAMVASTGLLQIRGGVCTGRSRLS